MHAHNMDAPLSNLIGSPDEKITGKRYRQVLDLFRRSELGIIATGQLEGTFGVTRTTDEFDLQLASTDHPDGQTRILAFADPDVFAIRYGPRFNARMSGEDLLRTVLANPNCEGILVNSATDEASFCIDRETAQSVLRSGGRKPPWKFW